MLSRESRRLSCEEVGDVTVITFEYKEIVDEGQVLQLGSQLFRFIEEDGRQKIILDFSKLEYLAQIATGKLILMDKKIKAAKGRWRMCGMNPDIYEVFAITKLNKTFDIKDNLEQALLGL